MDLLFRQNTTNSTNSDTPTNSTTPKLIGPFQNDFCDLISNLTLNSDVLGPHKNFKKLETLRNFEHNIQSRNLEKLSKFKTIKILVASNHKEFNLENHCLLHEVQPELQQYFMRFGYDFLFVDINLNYEFDTYLDPYLFQYVRNELEQCCELFDACFFMLLSGNKYGCMPLPIEISQVDYEIIKASALNLNMDFEFFKSWYLPDEFAINTVYRLRQPVESYPNLYNKNTNEFESYNTDQGFLKKTYDILYKIISSAFKNKSNIWNDSGTDRSQFFQSGNEILARYAMSRNPNGCLVLNREFEGIQSKQPNAKPYTDTVNSEENSVHQKKFSDYLACQLNDDNRVSLSLEWSDENVEIYENWYKYPVEELTKKIFEMSNSENPAKVHNYYHKFSSIVSSKLKNMIEKHILSNTLKTAEQDLYNEVTRHLYMFQTLAQEMYFPSIEFTERVNSLIDAGKLEEHYPIFIYGPGMSGRTKTAINFAQTAFMNIEDEFTRCLTVVKFSDLTSQCLNFENMFYTLCQQLCVINHLNPDEELRNKDFTKLIQSFYTLCSTFSTKNPKNNLLILIDSIKDFNIKKSMFKKTNVKNNHISWLFHQRLPVRVHMIVTIKKLTKKRVPTESTNSLQSNISSSSDPISDNNNNNNESMVSLFCSQMHELRSQHSCQIELINDELFELPFFADKKHKLEIGEFIKDELAKRNKYLARNQISLVTYNALNSSRFVNAASDDSADGLVYFFQYISLVLNELTDTYDSLFARGILDKHSLPFDCESFIRAKLLHIEKNFNSKVFSTICKYITATLNGITEMELIDLISCNNGFFSNYYKHNEMPVLLRFPVTQWLLIKNLLGNLLRRKFIDNKVTYSWSNELVKKVMKQKYFNNVDHIRLCHKDIANYFLETFLDSKPFIEPSRNLSVCNEEARRYVAMQPLVYSDGIYNFRRLNELWYHLMNSGDIKRLKTSTLFNFEYLLAKCHGTSVYNLLDGIDAVLCRILDPDIIMLNLFFKKSINTLLMDPVKLAPEVLSAMRPLKDDYGEHVKLLFEQAINWCDSHENPILVPLTSWYELPENLLISRIDHAMTASKIAITTFNQHVFFSTGNFEVCMYHVPSKKMVRKLVGHTDTINSLQITSNNKFLISCSSDKTIRVWNLDTGDIENSFACTESEILCSVLSHDNEYIVVGAANSIVYIIRLETGEVVLVGDKHIDAVTALALTNDDSILISASWDKSVIRWCWDEEGLELVDIILTVYSPVTSMVISNDRTFIILACENKKVQVKSLITGTDVHDLPTFKSAITALSVSNDCKLLYVACSDSKLYLYNFLTRELIATLIELSMGINDIRISEDNSFLFLTSGNSLYALNIRKKMFIAKKKSVKNGKGEGIKAMSLSKEGSLAITGNESGKVSLWSLADGKLMRDMIDSKKESVTALVIDNSHLFCVVAFSNCNVIVYDIELGDVAVTFREHEYPVKHLYTFSDRRVISADHLNSCKIWYAHSGQLLESITVDCHIFALPMNRKLVVSGKGDNIIKIWSFNGYKVIRSIEHSAKITALIFSKDSNFMITGSEDKNCKIWELSTGKLIQVLIEHTEAITSIDVNVENNLVITGSKDKLAIIWNFRDGSVSHKLDHGDEIVNVFLAARGSTAITGSKDSVINVWCTMYGHLLTSIDLHYTLADFKATSDGTRLIFRFEDCINFPIIGLTIKKLNRCHQKSSKFFNNSLSSLKSFDNNRIYSRVSSGSKRLPIKSTPVEAKKSKYFIKFFNSDESNKAWKKELSTTTDPVSNSKNETSVTIVSDKSKSFVSSTRDELSKKTSPADTDNNNQNSTERQKQKKTKICCMV